MRFVGAVRLAANAGAITDNGEAGVDVTANSAFLSSAGGIGGSGDPLEVAVNALTTTTTGLNASTWIDEATEVRS